MGARKAEPGAQLRGAHSVQLGRQCLRGGRVGAHQIAQFQRFRPVGDIPVILRRHRGGLGQKFAAVLHNQGTVFRQLFIVGVQQHPAVWRYIVAFQQRIFLGRQPHIPPQRHQIRPVHLAQRRIQKPPPPIRAALDKAQQIRLKHNGLKIPGQCRGTPNVRAVQPPGTPGPLAAFAAHCQPDAFFDVLCLKCAFQHRKFLAALYKLCILGTAEALSAGQQPDSLQQVRFALPIGAAQHGQVRVRVQLCVRNITMIR